MTQRWRDVVLEEMLTERCVRDSAMLCSAVSMSHEHHSIYIELPVKPSTAPCPVWSLCWCVGCAVRLESSGIVVGSCFALLWAELLDGPVLVFGGITCSLDNQYCV